MDIVISGVVSLFVGVVLLFLEYRYIRNVPPYQSSSSSFERKIIVKVQKLPRWARLLVYCAVVLIVFAAAFIFTKLLSSQPPPDTRPLQAQNVQENPELATVAAAKMKTDATVSAMQSVLLSHQLTRESQGIVVTPVPIPPPTLLPPSLISTPSLIGLSYGVQAQVYGDTDLGFVVGTSIGLGSDWVKFQLPWKDVEARKGAFAWSTIDKIVDRLNAGGLNILVSVGKAPQWARAANTDTDMEVEGPPADPQDFANFVGVLTARYAGKIQAVEVWNEQNLWYEWGNEPLSAGRYVVLLCRAYAAIKAVDPRLAVISGALTPTGVNNGKVAIDDVVYLQQMYAAGAKLCSDGIGAHPSGYNNPPDAKVDYSNPAEPSFKNHPSFFFRETMERYRAVMVANGDTDKRVWPTEFGWASAPNAHPGYEYAADNTLEEQAQYIVRAYQMAKGWGWVGPMFVWNLNFAMANPDTELAAFGLLGADGRPRPAYSALASMPK